MLSFFTAKLHGKSADDETAKVKHNICEQAQEVSVSLSNVFCVQGIGIDDLLQLSAEFVQQIISKQAGQEKGSVIDIRRWVHLGPNFICFQDRRFLRRTWVNWLPALFASKTPKTQR